MKNNPKNHKTPAYGREFCYYQIKVQEIISCWGAGATPRNNGL